MKLENIIDTFCDVSVKAKEIHTLLKQEQPGVEIILFPILHPYLKENINGRILQWATSWYLVKYPQAADYFVSASETHADGSASP